MSKIILVFHSVAGVQGNIQMKNGHLVITTARDTNFGVGKPDTHSWPYIQYVTFQVRFQMQI